MMKMAKLCKYSSRWNTCGRSYSYSWRAFYCRFYRVMVVRMPKGTEAEAPKPSDVKPGDEVSYEEAHESKKPAVYVAFQFKGSEYQKYRRFTVGGEHKSDNSHRDRREVKKYYNGPLEPETDYRIYARAFTSEVSTFPALFTSEVGKLTALLRVRRVHFPRFYGAR